MANIKYISFILFAIFLITLINLYYKPRLSNENAVVGWFERFTSPISKTNCPLQGFRCPSDEGPCDCEKMCSNGGEYVPVHIGRHDERVFVMNKKLVPGLYCLPEGADQCNLNANYHVFSLAGWSCLPLNEVVFHGDKQRACKNEEAADDQLNVLWDHLKNEEAGHNINDYYEPLKDGLRYRCNCGSKSIDGTPMISVIPFVCSVDYCLRDIPDPLPHMGWNGQVCECRPYFHLDPNDETSPCRRDQSRLENYTFTGRVDCMTETSFVRRSLFCPTSDGRVFFREKMLKSSSDPMKFVEILVDNKLI